MYAAITVGVIIVALSIFFVYSSDQAKERGKAFGKAVEFVQDDLRKLTHSFDSKVSMFKQGNISKGEFLEFTEKYVNAKSYVQYDDGEQLTQFRWFSYEEEMEKIILRYDNLQIPQPFVSAVELFKLSAETQLESDKHMIEWVRTGDDTAHVRSDQLLHQSFQYEQAALYEFELQLRNANP